MISLTDDVSGTVNGLWLDPGSYRDLRINGWCDITSQANETVLAVEVITLSHLPRCRSDGVDFDRIHAISANISSVAIQRIVGNQSRSIGNWAKRRGTGKAHFMPKSCWQIHAK